MDKGSNELDARVSIVGTDRIPVYTATGTEPELVAASLLSSGIILGDDNAFTGDNTFAGTSGFNGAVSVGKSGAAGDFSVYPSTATSGKLAVTVKNQTGDTTVTLDIDEHGQATVVNLPDGGAATTNLVQSTLPLSLAESDVLDGAVAGAQAASKVVIPNSDVNIGVVKATEFHLGATGSETKITSSGTKINYTDITTRGVVQVDKAVIVDANKDIADFRNLSSTNVLVGKDAEAGTVTVFPTTTAKGKTTITSSDNSGATITNVNVAAQAGARTLTIPDGGQATASFLLSEGSQTSAGVQTYTSPVVYDANTTITAYSTGGQANAVALTGEYNDVTTVAAAFDSVKLLTAVAGQTQTVKNSGAATLSVFPNTDDTINGMAVNLSVDIPVGGKVTFVATGVAAWETPETLYLSSATTQTGGIAISATASAGNTLTTITNASQAAARTYTIPDAGASAEFVMNTDLTDYQKFMGLNDIIGGPVYGPSVGTWTTTRVARGDYVTQKTATDETAIIPIDITEAIRTTTSKGLKLVSFDVIFRNITEALDAHTVTLDKMAYSDSSAVSTTSVSLTGSLATGVDNDPQVSNITIDTAAFNTTADSKYVMEITVNAAATSVYDFIGVMLKFTRNDK